MSLIAKYHNKEVVMDMTLKLFVGQVPKNFEESDLKPYFEKYGPLVNIKVCRDRDSKAHKGCAFVTFTNLDNAENAMHEMHDRIALPGAKKEMQIKAVHDDDNKKFDKRLFVGMISKSLNGDELKAMFEQFGEVVDCNILTSMINGEKMSRGCGFVKFAKASSCLQAIKEMHQSQTMEGCNSPLVVKHADSPADKMKRNASGFEEREDSKRNNFRHSAGGGMQQRAPFGGGNQYAGGNQYGNGVYPIAPPPQQPPPQNRNQFGGNNATASALISAFTPLLATVAEQNTPGTTRMLVESIKIALNALHHENTTSAQAAMVSIASSLSVAVANNLNKKTSSNFDHQSGGMFGNTSEFYNPAAPANNNNMNSSSFGSGMNNYYNTTPPGVQQYNRPN